MAHLLPSAGVSSWKSEGFVHHKVECGNYLRPPKTSIPANIHDYRYTDYKAINRRCVEIDEENERKLKIEKRLEMLKPINDSIKHGHNHTHGQHVRQQCPPAGDPRSLIRKLDAGIPARIRPTRAPYFDQESRSSCPPVKEPRVDKRGVFTFDDWLRTQKDREPTANLQGMCIPSVNSWCQPQKNYSDQIYYKVVSVDPSYYYY